MAKINRMKPATFREDTSDELLDAAHRQAQKAAKVQARDADTHQERGALVGKAGKGLQDDLESFLPGVTDRHVGAGEK